MSDASLSSALPNFPSQASEQASRSPLIAESKKKHYCFNYPKFCFLLIYYTNVNFPNLDLKLGIGCKTGNFGVAEFKRFGKRRFQSIPLKIGPESIEELIIIGSILL